MKFEQMESAIQDLKLNLSEKENACKRAINDKQSIEDRMNSLLTEIEVLKKDKKYLGDTNTTLLNENRS